MDETLGGLYIFVVLFLFGLAVLWFLLPFAIFGTKAKLDLLIIKTNRTNEILEKIREEISGPTRTESDDI